MTSRTCTRPDRTSDTSNRAARREFALGLARGDEWAIRELYRSYSGPVFVIARSLLGDTQQAEDALQETMVKVWRAAATFDVDRPFEPWLYQIARNVARDRARSRERRGGRLVLDHAEPGRPEVADDDPTLDPETMSERSRLQWDVRRAVDRLPEVDRLVVRLQHLEGLTHSEIATRLDIPIGTVKSRSHRAHTRLTTLLSQHQLAPADGEPPSISSRKRPTSSRNIAQAGSSA